MKKGENLRLESRARETGRVCSWCEVVLLAIWPGAKTSVVARTYPLRLFARGNGLEERVDFY